MITFPPVVFSNDPFVYVALTGVMEFCAILLATPFNIRLGRRIPLGVCFLAGGSSLLLDLAIPTGTWGWGG